MSFNPSVAGGSMAAGEAARQNVKQTAPGVWAVGPWPFVAVYRHEPLGVDWWECQQCRLQTTMPERFGCEHIRAVVNVI